MATIYDLLEVTDISENTTYSTAAGNLLGVVGSVSSADLNDGEFDEGDILLIGGVPYTIDRIQEPLNSGRFTLGDGSERSFNPQSEHSLDVVFLTVSNGGDIRYFVIPKDSYGDMNVQQIRTGALEDVAGHDAALVSTIDNNINVVCFAARTMILTPSGPRAVEHLRIGDPVWTRDHGAQTIRHIISSALDFSTAPEELKPVVFERGSLGQGLPSRRLMVSPQHRMLVTTAAGSPVLVPAKALTGRRGVRIAKGKRRVDYYHLVFSRHEIIRANDTLTESLFPGRMTLRAVPAPCRQEIQGIFGRDLLAAAGAPEEIAAAPILRVQDAKVTALRLR
ncbi:Hint domain-containing protein [Rhizorhabdus sp.]|uniref:Hint domain-containing protein n=1 Tax=Rhizorhabdus sp. TaxID=1968843 RepID=UPI0019881D8A|nr:Hint domain-containing protein [Rhizorhabdus sp.]MBD3763124.1 Hint domain-containing protein [Rhizorhabdus sp.]MBD3788628.1 Hint domain-containing protein [Sphingomonadales bacterium]